MEPPVTTAAPVNLDTAAQDRLFDGQITPAQTNVAAIQEYARSIRRKQALGERLSPVELKTLERAAFLEVSTVVWRDRADCAAEIKTLCGLTYNALDKRKCPWNAHGPTEKYPVLRWLAQILAGEVAVAKARAREAKVDCAVDREQEAARLRRLVAQTDHEETQVARLKERLRIEADDSARQIVIDLCGTLRRTLIDELPATLVELARAAPDDRAAAEQSIRAALDAAIARAMATPAPAPAPITTGVPA
jgi:hypothetical protein